MKARFTLLGGSVLAAAAALVMAQSANAQHIFWTQVDTGEVWTADAAGNNAQAIVTGLDSPRGIELDVANNHIYIAEDGTGSILRTPLSGGSPTTLVSGLGGGNAQMLQLDLGGGMMYWTQYADAAVQRANLDGSSIELLHDSADRFTGIGLDFDNNQLYASDPAAQPAENLWISGLDGSNPTSEARFDAWATNSHPIVGDQMYYSWNDELRQSDLDGSNEVTLGTIGHSANYMLGVTVGPDGNVYFGARNNNDHEESVIGFYDGNQFVDNWVDASYVFDVAVVPEPSTYALIFGGVVGALVLLRRRFRK